MKYGIPTCTHPTDQKSIYLRNLYHEFFWGPFENEQAVHEAIAVLDKADKYWDYDPFCIIYGANPLPKDYVFGFNSVDDAMAKRIRGRVRSN